MKSTHNQTFTFCHNDLHGDNMIFNSNTGRLTFIDYEYCGWSLASYDVANYFLEYASCEELNYEKDYPNEEHRRLWISKYLGRRQMNENTLEQQISDFRHFWSFLTNF